MSPTLLRQIDQVCNRFEDDCREGTRPAVDDVLNEVPAEARAALRKHLIGIDLAYRLQGRPTVLAEPPTVFAQRLSAADVLDGQEGAAGFETRTVRTRTGPLASASAAAAELKSTLHLPMSRWQIREQTGKCRQRRPTWANRREASHLQTTNRYVPAVSSATFTVKAASVGKSCCSALGCPRTSES